MRVIICGGRDFDDWDRLNKRLNTLRTTHEIKQVIQGEARGADLMAKHWALLNNIPVVSVAADWYDKNGNFDRSAGYRRNAAMADFQPDAVLAFPGGKGTAMMKQIAQKRGIKVIDL